MPNQAGTLEVLAREVGHALAPLEQRLAGGNALTLFAELGLQFPPALTAQAGVANALQAVVAAAAGLPPRIAQLATAISANNSSAIIQHGLALVNQIQAVISALNGLASQLQAVGGMPGIPASDIAAFAGQLSARLLEFMVVEYLETRQPAVASSLALIGLIEREAQPGIPGNAARPPFVVKRLRLNRLGELVQSPEQYAADVFGWGTPGFDGVILLHKLNQFLYDLGFPSHVLTNGVAPPVLEAFVFTVQPAPPGLQFDLHFPIEGGFNQSFPLTAPWVLRVETSGQFDAGVSGTITPPAQFAIAAASTLTGEIRAGLGASRPSDPFVLLGQAGGSRLEAGILALALGFGVTWDSATSTATGEPVVQAEVTGGKIIIDTSRSEGVLAALTSGLRVDATFDVRMTWRPSTGAQFEGNAALEIRRPINFTLGPLTVQNIYVRVALAAGGGIPLELSGGLLLALGPLAITIDRIGVAALLTFPSGGGNLGPANFAISFKPPDGAGIAIEAGPVSGGGFVRREQGPPERYSGALALKLTNFAVVAFGIFERTPSGRIAFVMVLGVRFFPGLQLGFGFALTGVGGLIGINRRADADALRERLVSGAAGNVLFAEDPIRNAPTLLADLGMMFPAADGVYVIGPTLQISWLAVARLDLGVIIELPGPSRVILLGVMRFQIGGEAGLPALIYIRLDILGIIDFVKKLVSFDAALVNSRLLQIFTLTGTAAFRLSTGDQPYSLLTIGGFHPAFNPEPVILPPQQRVGLTYDLHAGLHIWLRLEAYLAITSNTFQVGAALEVGVELGPLNALGFLSFDALIQFKPFYFRVDFRAGWRIRWESFTFAGVEVAGTLTGPGPITISARFTIEILFFDISWSDTFTLGEEGGESVEPVASLVQALAPELDKTANLQALGNEDREVGIAPKPAATKAVVSPQGQLVWTQKRAPLNVTLERFEGVPLAQPQAVIVESTTPNSAAQDWFSPGTFINLSESEALNRGGFERLDAGTQLGFGFQKSGTVSHTIEIETIRLPERNLLLLGWFFFPAILLQALAGRQAPVRIFDAVPIINVTNETWSVVGSGGTLTNMSQTEAHQQARMRGAVALPTLDAAEAIDLGGI